MEQFFVLYSTRCTTIKMILDYVNSIIADQDITNFKYKEIDYCLKNIMGYSWQKANIRPPKSLDQDLKNKQNIFRELIDKLNQACYTIVYIDESSFDAKALPLYTWHLKGSDS